MSDNEIKAVIAKYLKLRVRTHNDVIKATKISASTYFRKLANPQNLSIKELRLIFDYLKVPQEERRF